MRDVVVKTKQTISSLCNKCQCSNCINNSAKQIGRVPLEYSVHQWTEILREIVAHHQSRRDEWGKKKRHRHSDSQTNKWVDYKSKNIFLSAGFFCYNFINVSGFFSSFGQRTFVVKIFNNRGIPCERKNLTRKLFNV